MLDLASGQDSVRLYIYIDLFFFVPSISGIRIVALSVLVM